VMQLIAAVEENSQQFRFLQAGAGTGKTHTARFILSELREKGLRNLVSGTTRIAAVTCRGGKAIHSLFSLGKKERQSRSFTSNFGRGTARAPRLWSTCLIVADEASMLKP
jgi:hypothetical protein